MVINKTVRNAYLQRYVNSKGRELPPDYDMYEDDKAWRQQCVFCGELHSNIPLYRYDPLYQTREKTGAHTCKTCDVPVMQMKKISYYNHWVEDNDVEKRDKYDEHDYGNRSYKINLYNTTYQFDDTVSKYYIGRGSGRHLCYFCGQVAETDDPEVLVPVENSLDLTGGRVKVCTIRCIKDLWNPDELPPNFTEEKCTHCSTKYIITEDELKARTLNKTVGKHMCPECTYYGIETEQKKNSVLADETNKSVPYARFIHNFCSICNEPLSLDLTMLHSKLRKIHTSRKGKIRCQHCYIFKIENVKEKIAIEVNNVFCVLFYLDKNWSYRISTIRNNEEIVLFRPAATYKVSDRMTALADAVEAATSLVEGNQTKLDL